METPPLESQTGNVPSVTAEGESLPSNPQRLRYSSIAAPDFGGHTRIGSRVLWSRVPLPIDLNHINVWLIESNEGYLLVDTGMSADMCKEAWQRIHDDLFARIAPRALFVTHVHPDHIGLASWLQERYAMPVWMSEQSLALAEGVYGARSPSSAEIERFLRTHGVDDSTVHALFKPERFGRMMKGLPHIERFIEDSEHIDWGDGDWTALRTDGHADGHLCLWNEREHILISGDQVLPTISSNISITFRRPDANPLRDYLSSLERLRELPEDTLVLPSHGRPFYGLHQRIDDLFAHHETQLAKLKSACVTPLSAREVLPFLFRRELAGMHFLLALGEAVAHLEYLAHSGELQRERRGDAVVYRVRSDGVTE